MVSRSSSAVTKAFSRTAERSKLSPKSKHPNQFQTPTPLEKFKTGCKSSSEINTNDAFTTFYNMLKMKPLPPNSSFNKLIGAIAKTKNYQDIISMYHRMVQFDIFPGYITLNILLNCYCSLFRVSFGFAVMGGIFKRGHRPDIVTFCSLIDGLFREGKIDDAVGSFKKIIKMDFQPDICTWEILIKGLYGSGNSVVALGLHEAARYWNGRPDLRFKLDIVCYNTLIHGLCKEGLVDKGSISSK